MLCKKNPHAASRDFLLPAGLREEIGNGHYRGAVEFFEYEQMQFVTRHQIIGQPALGFFSGEFFAHFLADGCCRFVNH